MNSLAINLLFFNSAANMLFISSFSIHHLSVNGFSASWETEAAGVPPLTYTSDLNCHVLVNISVDAAARPAAAESAEQRRSHRATWWNKLPQQRRAGCSSGTFSSYCPHRVFGIIKMIYESHWFESNYNSKGFCFQCVLRLEFRDQ